MKLNRVRWISTMALCLVCASSAMAQFTDGSEAVSKAWSKFALSKTKKVKVNFKNASPDMVLQFFMDQSGITIAHDPSFRDPLTVVSATPVTLDRAFEILNTVIGLRGYRMEQQGDLLVIRPKDQQNNGTVVTQGLPTDFQTQPESRLKLETYFIKFANATEVARVINDVFSSTNSPQNNPFQFNNRGRGGRGGAVFAFGGPNGFQVGNNGNQQTPFVRASSDDFSNSVIVNASPNDQVQVKAIIAQIDRETDTPIQPKVFKLQYASANDLAPIVQNVLTSNQPKGRGGQGNSQPNFGQQLGTALRFGNAAASFGNVVADVRTNSLVVSTTLDNLALIDQVIKDLDKPTEIQDTTYVFPLQNAKADTLAQLLQAAFGTRQGVSGGGLNQLNQNSANRGPNTPNVTSGGNRTGAAGGAGGRTATPLGGLNQGGQNLNAMTPDQQNLLLALQDPNATSGELLTSIGVAQGGFGGGGFAQRLGGAFGGQNSQSNYGTSTLPNGQIVNTRDLSGQITVIPDTDTNQIIVVAPPGSVDILRKIIDELDKIPQQVMIDVIIVEANLDTTDNLGFEWNLVQQRVFGDPAKTGTASTNFGLATSTTPLQGLKYALTGGDLGGLLNALQTKTKFDVLASPKIFTTNNVQATINISQSVPYVLSSIQDATTGALSFNYGFENVGIVLTITPRITANGYVQLDLDQTANDLQGYTSFNAPIVNQREATTRVSVQDGKTVVLGGIIQRTVSATTNKVPLLGDIPILGKLFQSSTKTENKTELLIFLSPHIVKNADDANKVTQDSIKQVTPRTQGTINNILQSGGSVVGSDGKAKVPPTKVPPPSDSQRRTGGG